MKKCYEFTAVIFLLLSIFNIAYAVDSDIQVCTVSGDQSGHEIIPDGMGNSIIVWSDGRDLIFDESYRYEHRDIYAQKIDPFGNEKWKINGALICSERSRKGGMDLTADGRGGTIIVWDDDRNNRGINSDIYAQKIDAFGEIQWSEEGVKICVTDGRQGNPHIVSDGEGGSVIAWIDNRNNAPSRNYQIYAQRIDRNGNPRWAVDGIPVCNPLVSFNFFNMTSDGNGGAIVVWSGFGNYGEGTYAQRLDKNGNLRWGNTGVLVYNRHIDGIRSKITYDYFGGAYFVWQDIRTTSNGIDIYAQRIDRNGIKRWGESGVPVCTAFGNQENFDIVSIPSGVVIAWEDGRKKDRGASNNIYAQKLDINGRIIWVRNGMPVCTAFGYQGHINVAKMTTRGVLVVWDDARNINNNNAGQLSQEMNFDIYAQWIDNNGNTMWNMDGVPVCTKTKAQLGPRLISNPVNNRACAIVVWNDYRNIPRNVTNLSILKYSDLYAQILDMNGHVSR